MATSIFHEEPLGPFTTEGNRIGPVRSRRSLVSPRCRHRVGGRLERLPVAAVRDERHVQVEPLIIDTGSLTAVEIVTDRLSRARRRLHALIRERVFHLLYEPRGVETGGYLTLEELGVAAPDRISFEPSPFDLLVQAFQSMKVRDADVFVDYGSGKGRVLIQAALRFPFRKVIGVEISDRLTQIARANVDRARHRFKADEVELVTADAAAWRLHDDVTHIYMANPFIGETFRSVLDRISESLDRSPRRLTVIYLNPIHDDLLLASGRFERVDESEDPRSGTGTGHVRVYRSRDPTTGAPTSRRP